MTPPHPDVMARMLLVDPFWVAPSEVERLTDREMWLDYIRPALEAQRDRDKPVREEDPEGTIRDDKGRVVSTEQFLSMMAGAGLADPKQVAEVIQGAKEKKAGEK